MKKENTSRSSLLLMEIILAILFFSIISAVCLQIFVKSHTLSQDSKVLDSAVNEAGSVADILSTSTEPVKVLRSYYPGLREKNGELYIYFDKDFKQCKTGSPSYRMVLSHRGEDKGLFTYRLDILTEASNTSVYDLDIITYRQIQP